VTTADGGPAGNGEIVEPIRLDTAAVAVLRSEESSATIALEGVTKNYGSTVAVKELDLVANAGEFLVLLGPSGCGKSTVLRLIAGLEQLTGGTIRIGSDVVNDIEPRDRDVAMVFQSYALYPHLSVRKNIEFPLRARHVPTPERATLVTEAAQSLQLESLLDRRPGQLSGGQRQRVALARAIVRRPRAFLMDEPLSNLDARLRVEMRAELIDLHRRLGTTVVYVTHDQVEAMTMGHRIAIMRDGELQQVGPPQAVHDDPANVFVAGFIGSPAMNLLGGEIASGAGGATEVTVSGGTLRSATRALSPEAPIGRHVTLGARPEDLVVGPDGTVEATVSLVEALGHEFHVACRQPDGRMLTVRVAGSAKPPAVGDGVRLGCVGRIYLFDADTGVRIDG
jgi:multiple sugar transport system ATP-binding protein